MTTHKITDFRQPLPRQVAKLEEIQDYVSGSLAKFLTYYIALDGETIEEQHIFIGIGDMLPIGGNYCSNWRAVETRKGYVKFENGAIFSPGDTLSTH